MSDLFFALSRQGRGMADKNRRIPVNRAALPMDGKNLPARGFGLMRQVQAAWRSECARKVRKSPNPPGLQEML